MVPAITASVNIITDMEDIIEGYTVMSSVGMSQ